ncbi:unnamed protein product [Anisakis simplex]|uniref:Uncharacterized protein n=1 Tax=Anisakis simplex TaxID=6269 RepID=A0A0M3JRY6_ANISI|nr:unnamed protein product [Anisakis simplex]
MQALEGRCSTRSNVAKEYANHISEFTTTLKCFLIDQLNKKLEELNEPDRLLISRLKRALCELGDQQSTVLSRPTVYHLPSPSRPAHRVWTMCTKDPQGLEKLINDVCAMAGIPYKEKEIEEKPCDVRFSALPPSLWNLNACANSLLEQNEVDETAVARQQQNTRHFNSMSSINGYPLYKSSSSIATSSHLSSPSLPSPITTIHQQQQTQFNIVQPTNDVDNYSTLYNSSTSFLRKAFLSNGHLPSSNLSSFNSAQPQTQQPVEANVHVLRRSSFRERSLPSESDSSVVLKDDSFNISNPLSIADSTCPSVASSIPPCPSANANTSFDSQQSRALSEETNFSSCDPSSSSTTTIIVNEHNVDQFYHHFGENYLTRPIDVIALPVFNNEQQRLAVSDSCGGVYITTTSGKILKQLPIKNSSASSLAIDLCNVRLLVSVMHAKGRTIHIFDIKDDFHHIETIPCPKEPKIELSRTRWITVSPRGEIFVVSGDNNKSAIWMYNRSRKGWKTLKDSRKTRYQYLCVAEDQAEYRLCVCINYASCEVIICRVDEKAVVLLTCDASQNRLLLFVVDHSGTLINEYDLTKTYHLNEHIGNPASALVDELGNLIVLDYASGRLWILLSGVKGVRRLKEIIFPRPLGTQQALGIAVCNDWVYVTCFNRREVVSVRYLYDGTFFNAFPLSSSQNQHSSSGEQRRAISLPRPSSSSVRL